MQRVFGALAVFVGWLSVPVAAFSGLMASEFFGLTHVEGNVAPSAVYGISGAVILWVFVAAAILLALPAISAMVAPDPRKPLRIIAIAMGITGLVLLPDELGRAYGLPLLVGALFMVAGGDLIQSASASTSAREATGGWPAAAEPSGPASSLADPAAAAAADAAPAGRTASPRARRGQAGSHVTGQRTCPWCSTEVPAGAPACPNCQATLDEPASESMAIPGVTEVPSDLRRYDEAVRTKKKRPSLLRMVFSDTPVPTATNGPDPSDPAALRPPSSELKAEMARLDAEIASGGVFADSTVGRPIPAEGESEATPPATAAPRRTRKPRQPGP